MSDFSIFTYKKFINYLHYITNIYYKQREFKLWPFVHLCFGSTFAA